MESQGLPKCPCFEGTWKGQQKATNSVWKVSQMYAYINMCVYTHIYILFYLFIYLFIYFFHIRMVLHNSIIQTYLIIYYIYMYISWCIYIYMYVCVHISCVCMHACMSAHASWGWRRRCLDLGPESHDPWSHAYLLLCGIEQPWRKIYVANPNFRGMTTDFQMAPNW